MSTHLGDNCIQNDHLGRYNVGYTLSGHKWVPKMANVVSFENFLVHLKFEWFVNEECKLSEILNISLFAIFQLKSAWLL